jgi:glutamate formiminotransferase
MVAVVECVPNFSEGRRHEVMDAIQAAAESVAGLMILDRHADAVHNRMVLTFAGAPGQVAEAAFRCVARAAELIDLRLQPRGVHPRIGATDVLPFVPLGSTSMQLCIELAQRVGRRVGAELDLPVYLYGEAATRPERRKLADVRRGEYEHLLAHIAQEARLAPDFGPARLGPAGATVVGARRPLIAYNVTLATSDLAIAKSIARGVRQSNGGLPSVQARGFPTADPKIMQVSMNILDAQRAPLWRVFEHICHAAAQHGVEVIESELVGLAPADALIGIARECLRFRELTGRAAIETRVVEHTWGNLPLFAGRKGLAEDAARG